MIVKNRRCVASNTKFDIYFDHIVDRSGFEVPDFLVVKPKGDRAHGVTGVCVLPIVGTQIAMVRCHRHPTGTRLWEAPRGFIDDGESASEAALRELNEETGLSCGPTSLVPLGIAAPEAGVLSGRIALFAALDCTGELGPDNNDIGVETAQLFDDDQVALQASEGGIEDAVTLVTYFRFRAWKNRIGT